MNAVEHFIVKSEATVHELKADPACFEAVHNGTKNSEIRENDRNFKAGDVLLLRETLHTGQAMNTAQAAFDGKVAPLVYTGRTLRKLVGHVQSGYGLMAGHVALSLKPVPQPSRKVCCGEWHTCTRACTPRGEHNALHGTEFTELRVVDSMPIPTGELLT